LRGVSLHHHLREFLLELSGCGLSDTEPAAELDGGDGLLGLRHVVHEVEPSRERVLVLAKIVPAVRDAWSERVDALGTREWCSCGPYCDLCKRMPVRRCDSGPANQSRTWYLFLRCGSARGRHPGRAVRQAGRKYPAATHHRFRSRIE